MDVASVSNPTPASLYDARRFRSPLTSVRLRSSCSLTTRPPTPASSLLSSRMAEMVSSAAAASSRLRSCAPCRRAKVAVAPRPITPSAIDSKSCWDFFLFSASFSSALARSSACFFPLSKTSSRSTNIAVSCSPAVTATPAASAYGPPSRDAIDVTLFDAPRMAPWKPPVPSEVTKSSRAKMPCWSAAWLRLPAFW